MKVKISQEKLQELALKYFVQSPSQQAQSFVELCDHLYEGGGLKWGNKLDTILRPLVGGDLAMLLMRTGHGKTTVSLGMARDAANRIISGEIKKENPVIVFVTLEQQAEHVELMLAGNEQFDSSQLIRGEVHPDSYHPYSTGRGSLPLWVIGQSRRHSNIKTPEIYLETVIAGIEGIRYEYGYNPILVYVDYLQEIRLMEGSWENTNKQVVEAARALKAMAMDLDIPVVFGSQAAQRVDNYKDKLPQLNDSMWASEGTHKPDFVITGMRPSRYWEPDLHPYVTIGNTEYVNNDKTLILRILKQRFGPGWGTISVDFTPQTLAIEDRGETFNLNAAETWAQGDMFNDE
jgi:replicative DNA helicase